MMLAAWGIYAAISASSAFTPYQNLGLGAMCVERRENPGDLNGVPMVVVFRGDGPNPFFGGEVSLYGGGAACLWLAPAKYRVEVTFQPDIDTLKNFSKDVLVSKDVILDGQNTKQMTICMGYQSHRRSGPYRWTIIEGDLKCP
jgi:hypothetical protein